MKIDNSVKGGGSIVNGGITRQRADSAAAPTQNEAPSAQVQISSLSSSSLDGAVANAPITNPNRIAEIKQAIAEGRFTVNADKIADGLLNSVRQLLDKPGSSTS